MSTFPSQFAGWLAVADRDGLGGAAAEPAAIRRGQTRVLKLALPTDADFGDWTAGTFTAVLRAAPGAEGDPLATYTCTTGTPASGVTTITLELAGDAQGDLPAADPALGLAEVFLEVDYTVGDESLTLLATRQLIAEVV